MKKKILIATIAIIAIIAMLYANQTTIEYNAPIQQTDTIATAQQKIKIQIQVLNNKDKSLEDQITTLEAQRERIREIKMSFSSALK